MVIILKFVTGSLKLFKMQFQLWLVYLTVQLQTVWLQTVQFDDQLSDYMIESQYKKVNGLLNQSH